MTTRTIKNAQGVWQVRDVGPGLEEWVRTAGPATNGSASCFRAFPPGSCGLVDHPPSRSQPAASRSRPARRRSPQARSAAKPITGAVLTAFARSQIIQELLDWEDGPHEARETGGHLVGRLDGSTLVLTAAFGPGPNAVRAHGMLSLDLSYTKTVRNACLPDEGVVGLWHSHPGRPDPSRADLRHWAGEARWLSARGLSFTKPAYLGVIATRMGADWAYPRFWSWMSWGDEHHADRIELKEERWRL